MKTRQVFSSLSLLLGLALAASGQPVDIRQGLIAYWPLESTDGSITADATPFGNNLSLTSMDASSFVPGRFGNAANFNGSSSYLIRTHLPDDYPAMGLPIYRAGSYTIAFWVKGPAQTGRYLFSEGGTASNNPLLILQTGQQATNNAKFDVIIRTDGNTTLINHVQSTNIVFDGNWHHIAWVDDFGQARLYVDGVLDPANFNYTPAGTFTFHTTVLGHLVRATVPTAGYFNGQMDDVAVWERALSQAEVQQVMNNSLEAPVPEFPPYITRGPANATRQVGDRVTFTMRAVGNRPLNHQWYRGNDAIPSATTSTLTLSNLTVADSDTYRVEVQNVDGTVTASATLTVLPDPPPDIRRGLVSHWPLEVQNDDGLGNLTTPDLYSRNDMALVNMDLGNEAIGVSGTAYAFDGVADYTARVGGFPIYNNSALSAALWVNVNGVGQSDRRFFSESSTNTTNPLFCFGTQASGADGRIRVYIRSDSGGLALDRYSTGAPLDGTWHHFVWTDTNGRGKLYIDGVLDATDFTYTRTNLTLNQTVLGAILRNTVGNHCAGLLDEIALWNRVLSHTEIEEIRLSGIPAPLAPTPPEITEDPLSQSVLTRSRVTFSFLATGTGPLLPQWRKDGNNLENETNATLRLNNVTLDAAGDYDVVVANSVGRATSQVATLTVTLRPPPPPSLRIDFNNTGAETPADTEPGFLSFALPAIGFGPFTRTYEGADVSVTGVGAILESRKRTTPSNAVDFTEAKLFTDFIFARDTALEQGMDIAVEFMQPSTAYAITLRSFDSGSAGSARVSDWFANGELARTAYSFLGSDLPTDNDRYRFRFNTTSDADGKILLQGRRSASATVGINVFLNALEVIPREIRILRIELLPLDESLLLTIESLLLTIEVLDPLAEHRVEEKVQLSDPDWNDAGAGFGLPEGNVLQAIVPIPVAGTRFYRVIQEP